jgi:hypothetical protein
MKGFTPDMLVQQLIIKEKYNCKISDILNIKYMDRDKYRIDHKCCDFYSFVDMVESAKIIPDKKFCVEDTCISHCVNVSG